MRNITIKEAARIMVAEGIGEEREPLSEATKGIRILGTWFTQAGSVMECIENDQQHVTVNLFTSAEVR